MAIVRRTFLASKMNKDLDERLLQDGEYRDALNIRLANSESSNVGAIEKSLSNMLVSELSIGDNVKTIGSVSDEFEEKIYLLLKSDLGCYIVEYDVNTKATVFVLKDTRVGALNVLNFSESFLVTGINIVIDSDNANRLLLFTDGNTQPKCVNIERAKGYALNGFTEEMILVIKKPPLDAPSIVLSSTPDEENNIEEKFISFSYRYKYLDGEFSACSPFSTYAFDPKAFNYDYSTGINESMINAHNKVDVTINTGSSLITDIQVVFKESGGNALYLIENYNKAKQIWANSTPTVPVFVSVSFTNNKIYKVLAEKELFRIYDNVPLKAQAQDIIDNTLVYGNYTENQNVADSLNAKINIDLTVAKVSAAIVSGVATRSLKSNRDYEVGISYLDEYGRLTTPLTSEKNTVYIPNSDSINQNKIKVTVANKAPDFAKYYRFFIKQTKGDYETIVPVLFYEDGAYRWVRLESADKDKVKENDYLIVKSDSQGSTAGVNYVKILEVKSQNANFLSNVVIDPINQGSDIKEVSGLYFKIKPKFRMNRADFSFYEFDTYTEGWYYDTYDRLYNTSPTIENAVYYGLGKNDVVSTGSTAYTGTSDLRYLIEIDSLQTASKGSVTLNTGASGSVDGITVNGVQIMSVAVPFTTDLPTTASAVAANITANTSVPNYTAIAVGNVIEITPITKGISTNGFVVVSTTTTITKTDVNLSGGKENTFRWSIDKGANYVQSLVEITSGVAQALSNGVKITFTNGNTGYALSDSWGISAFTDLNNDKRKAYGFYKFTDIVAGVKTNESVYAGAVVNFKYDEYNAENILISFSDVSSQNYENIEEWFYGENIIDKMLPLTDDNIFFRRGDVKSAPFGQFTQDPLGVMCMIIRSNGTMNNRFDKRPQVKSNIDIFQSITKIIFETKPKDYNSDVFFEIGRTYPIDANKNHLGYNVGDTNQSTGVSAILNLDIFNCYSWGNGHESYKIKDGFNAKTLNFDTRPSVPIENYRQNKRIAAITYSQTYEQTTNYNGLNEFNLSLMNFYDLDDKYGAIQKIVSWNDDLDIFQEDKVHKLLYRKSILYNNDGTSNLGKSDEVFGGIKPYVGEFGISKNPESLTVYGNYIYWADAKRGVILRKGQSGIEIISNFGMQSWFREIFKGNLGNILGGYDPYFGQYIISLGGYTLTFDEKVKGWTSFHSYLPDSIIRVNNRLFTVKDGNTYIHNETLNGYNEFYGQQFSSSVQTIFNDTNFEDSIFKNIILESDLPWRVVLATNYTNSTIPKSEFTKRESRYFASIKGNENESDLRGVTQGIGNIISANSNILTFANVTNLVSVGDKLYQVNGVNKELLGEITGINNNQITIDADVISPIINLFAYSKSNSRVNGVSIRGYFLNVTLIDDSNTANELFGASIGYSKSYL